MTARLEHERGQCEAVPWGADHTGLGRSKIVHAFRVSFPPPRQGEDITSFRAFDPQYILGVVIYFSCPKYLSGLLGSFYPIELNSVQRIKDGTVC